MSDKLLIEHIHATCRVGVTEKERRRSQKILVDVALKVNVARAAARDALRYAVDYVKVASVVHNTATSRSYVLIETLAEDIAAAILEGFAVDEVFVRLRKYSLPGIGYAAIEITRRLSSIRKGSMSQRNGLFPTAARRLRESAFSSHIRRRASR